MSLPIDSDAPAADLSRFDDDSAEEMYSDIPDGSCDAVIGGARVTETASSARPAVTWKLRIPGRPLPHGRGRETSMAKTKALCIFGTLLGNKTMVSKLVEALDGLPELEPTYVLIGPEDYAKYRAPWWARTMDPWEFEFVARRKAQGALDGRFDILLVNSWELAVEFRELARALPSAVVLDATPATIHRQLRQRGITGWKRTLANQVHHRSFAVVAGRFDYFLPKGSECADSLHFDYGIARERCFTTLAPQHLDSWKPTARSYSPPARLLFVGNDFTRKGGDFLLRLYADHLAGFCTLTIASDDPAMKGERLPPGVEWLRGKRRDELLPVFQSSDIFVFPSQQDFTPEVLCEALAVGLPCFTTDIEGVRDLVRNGETGFRMPRGASAEAWAAQLHRLLANPAEIGRMSANARRFAEENLNFDRFTSLIADVMERLRVTAQRGKR